MLSNLRKIKADIDKEEMEIKTVRKTQNADMFIELSKKCNKKKELTAVMTRKLMDCKKIAKLKDKETILITGMDAVAALKGVRDEIRKRLKVEFKVQPLRLGFADCIRTHVVLRAASAELPLQKGVRKIGYSNVKAQR